MESTLPALVGSPKQVAFAGRIRSAWIASQEVQLALELKIIAGEAVAGVDLAEGVDPKGEELRDAFVAIHDRRVKALRELTATRTSAKGWIESPEGRWALNFGPMKRG